MTVPYFELPSYEAQQQRLDALQSNIDRELRATGFETFVASHGLDATAGRLVVARAFVYSSRLADIDRDLDPTAIRIGMIREVGVATETNSWRSYVGLAVLSGPAGGPLEPTPEAAHLDEIQLATVEGAVSRLIDKKQSGIIPLLTKSLRKVDFAGD